MIHRIVNQSKVRLNHTLRDALGLSRGYTFSPAGSIRDQWIQFDAGRGPLTITSDGTMPLYETIAEIVDGDCYQLRTMTLSDSPDGLVIDIGANVGIFSIVVAQTYPGELLSIEPVPANVTRLRANVKANNIKNITVLPAAVAERDGELELYLEETAVGAHIATHAERQQGQNIAAVPGISLTTLLGQHAHQVIDLIKLDCEGAEHAILESVSPGDLRSVNHMSLEVHDLSKAHNLKTLQRQVERLGFRTRTAPDWFGRRRLNHLVAYHD